MFITDHEQQSEMEMEARISTGPSGNQTTLVVQRAGYQLV